MRFILSILAVFALGLVALTACQNAPVQEVAVEKAKTNTAPAPKKEEHTDDAPRITLEEAKKAFDQGEAVFVDTRGATTFQKEHIKGAVNLPAEAAATKYNEIPKGKKIIAYCS